MATLKSIFRYTGTGAAQVLNVPPYLSKTHITVYVDGVVDSGFAWLTPSTIQITAPVDSLVVVQRKTSHDKRLVDYNGSVPLTESDLDLDSLHAFYMGQEARDVYDDIVSLSDAPLSDALTAAIQANVSAQQAATSAVEAAAEAGSIMGNEWVSAPTKTIRNNPTAPTVAGEVPGLKIGLCDGTEPGWLLNPAANDFVAIYPYVVSSAARTRIWAMNPIVDVPAGFPATAWCYEGNINIGTADTPDPRNTNHAIGADMVSGGTYAPSSAFGTFASSLANRWKHGLWFDGIGGQVGSTLIKTNVDVSVDQGIDLSTATINYQALRIGNTPVAQQAGVGIRQKANGVVGLFLQRADDVSPSGNAIQLVNSANSLVLAALDVYGNLTCKDIISPQINNGGGVLALGDPTGTIQLKPSLFALGGGAAPTLGTIGGTGPTTAAQNSWVRFLDEAGQPFWVPTWR